MKIGPFTQDGITVGPLDVPEPVEQDGKWWEAMEYRPAMIKDSYRIENDGVHIVTGIPSARPVWINKLIPRATAAELAAIGMKERDGRPVLVEDGNMIWDYDGINKVPVIQNYVGRYRFVLIPSNKAHAPDCAVNLNARHDCSCGADKPKRKGWHDVDDFYKDDPPVSDWDGPVPPAPSTVADKYLDIIRRARKELVEGRKNGDADVDDVDDNYFEAVKILDEIDACPECGVPGCMDIEHPPSRDFPGHTDAEHPPTGNITPCDYGNPTPDSKPCPVCGKKWCTEFHSVPAQPADKQQPKELPCPNCGATGTLNGKTCWICGGNKTLPVLDENVLKAQTAAQPAPGTLNSDVPDKDGYIYFDDGRPKVDGDEVHRKDGRWVASLHLSHEKTDLGKRYRRKVKPEPPKAEVHTSCFGCWNLRVGPGPAHHDCNTCWELNDAGNEYLRRNWTPAPAEEPRFTASQCAAWIRGNILIGCDGTESPRYAERNRLVRWLADESGDPEEGIAAVTGKEVSK